MLQLRTNNYEFASLISSEYRRFDYNLRGATCVPDVGYIRSIYVECALAPLVFNEIGIYQQSYGLNDNYTIQNAIADIEEVYSNLSQTRLGLLRIYTNKVDETYDNLTSDLFTLPPTAVQELYNKCMDQVKLRENLNNTIKTKIKLMKGKHIIVLVTNYSDVDQASDYYLTLGLIPVLFQDWKDKFNELELEYFKVLVNRSQVKRISNVKAHKAFENIVLSNKYRNLLYTIRLITTIENIVTNRINSTRRTIQDSDQRATMLLQQYQDIKNKYYEASITLSNLEKSREDVIEELNTAINMEGIVDVQQYNDTTLKITLCAPATFFNTDEAELVVNNMRDNWVKRLFNDVFVEQKYKMMIVSEFYFSYTEGRRFQEPSEVDIAVLTKYNAMYNPHTYFFRCLGDYKPQLIDAQAKQDLLIFNNLALASVKSINFRDGAVINRWKDTLYSYSENNNHQSNMIMNIKCLIDEKGKSYSFNDLYFPPAVELEPTELDVEEL